MRRSIGSEVQAGFCDYPRLVDPLVEDRESGFYLDEYELDKDNWSEGFISEYWAE
jgi:hypothetical protein